MKSANPARFLFWHIPLVTFHKMPNPKTKKKEFKPPRIFEHQETLFLMFNNEFSMKLALNRVHVYYEQQELKGPLRGINMPTQILFDWKQNVELTEFELLIINQLEDYKYLIAYLNGDNSTLLHEWCHSVYYFNTSYQSLVKDYWNNLQPRTREHIKLELKMRNYSEIVYEDEFQAYVRENPSDFGKKWTSELQLVHQKLKSMVNVPLLVEIHYL